jgi:hypothetical protein
MNKYLYFFLLNSFISFSQIKIIEQKSNNDVKFIGKISYTYAYQKDGLSRKLPVLDPLKILGNLELNQYKHLRKEVNSRYKSVSIRKRWFIDEDLSATLLFFEKESKYLLSFKNINYNYQYESLWLSKQTKKELYNLIENELKKRIGYKNIEVMLDNQIVLLLSVNKNKVSFNLWDGNDWVKSSWYRMYRIKKLFGH